MTVFDLLDRYALVARSEGLSESNIAIVRQSVRRFDTFLGGISDVARVTADDLRRFIVDFGQRTRWQDTDQARPEPVSPTTVNTYVKRIRSFWSWLEREKIIKNNVLAGVRPPKASQKSPRVFEEDIIRKVLSTVADEPRELALIMFFLDTGVTLQEVVDLDDKNVD